MDKRVGGQFFAILRGHLLWTVPSSEIKKFFSPNFNKNTVSALHQPDSPPSFAQLINFSVFHFTLKIWNQGLSIKYSAVKGEGVGLRTFY